MARTLGKGKLSFGGTSWFILTEKGGKIRLPDWVEPLVVKLVGLGGMVRIQNELDRRREATRHEGMVILYRIRRHNGRSYIRSWSVCPKRLIEQSQIILLSSKKGNGIKQHRYGPHRLLLRQAG